MSQRLIKALRLLADVAIVLAALVIVYLSGAKYLSSSTAAVRDRSDRGNTGEYAPGELVSLRPEFSDGYKPTLIVFLQSSCRFCEASLPFYRQLEAAVDGSGHSTEIILASAEPQESIRQYAEANGLRSSKLVSVRQGDLKVEATPTVILTDEKGGVRRVWRGRLSGIEERRVIAAVTQRAK